VSQSRRGRDAQIKSIRRGLAVAQRKSEPWSELVTAMLSVNNYPLVKTFECFESLSANGVFDPSNYITWNGSEIARRLVKSGYDRGPVLTEMLGERLSSLRVLCDDLSSNEVRLSTGDRQELTALLAKVKGIGPQVLDNFLLLRGKPADKR
jgi:hypothetical protein